MVQVWGAVTWEGLKMFHRILRCWFKMRCVLLESESWFFRILSENRCFLVPLQLRISYFQGSVYSQNLSGEEKSLRVAESTPALWRAEHVTAYKITKTLGETEIWVVKGVSVGELTCLNNFVSRPPMRFNKLQGWLCDLEFMQCHCLY